MPMWLYRSRVAGFHQIFNTKGRGMRKLSSACHWLRDPRVKDGSYWWSEVTNICWHTRAIMSPDSKTGQSTCTLDAMLSIR